MTHTDKATHHSTATSQTRTHQVASAATGPVPRVDAMVDSMGGAAENAGTVLRGLPGDNPLGFFAALGAQTALALQGNERQLAWNNDPIPHPVLHPAVELEEVAESVLAVAAEWLEGPALEKGINPTLKLKPSGEIRHYLRRSRDAGNSGVLAACLLAEGSVDNNGKAKPTDLYFLAARQELVTMARTILGDATEKEIIDDICKPWSYRSRRCSLMWDSVDDRLHAYSALDPTSTQNPKLTNPGAETLAIVGVSRYPCFTSPGRTLTQGCSGNWKSGAFIWPLWTVPASLHSVGSLLAAVASPESSDNRRRADWYPSWGVSQLLQSQIRRSDSGGFGTFGPARVVWQRES